MGLMTVKEPSSTTDSIADLGPIDSAELVYSPWLPLRSVSVLFLKFFVCFGQDNKGIFCQLNDYAKPGLNETRMSQQLLGQLYS